MSRLVGATPAEVAAMGTLTSNLHLLLASFYVPTETRFKVLLDWKAFPSDHVRFILTQIKADRKRLTVY